MNIKTISAAALCLGFLSGCGSDSNSSSSGGSTHGDVIKQTDLSSVKIDSEGVDGLWLLVEHAEVVTKGSEDGVDWEDNESIDIKSYVKVERISEQVISIDRCDDMQVDLTLSEGKYFSNSQTNLGNYEVSIVDNNEMAGSIFQENGYYEETTTRTASFTMVKVNESSEGFIGTVEYNINDNGTVDEGSSDITCYSESYEEVEYQYDLNTRKKYNQSYAGIVLANRYSFDVFDDSDGEDDINIYRPNLSSIYDATLDSISTSFEENSAVIELDATNSSGVKATLDIIEVTH